MSHYAWEAGTIVLPSAEFTKVKDAVLTAATHRNTWLYEKSQEFWKLLPAKAKRDIGNYNRLVQAFVCGNDPARDPEVWVGGGKRVKNDLPRLPGVVERGQDAYDNVLAGDLLDALTGPAVHELKTIERVAYNGQTVSHQQYVQRDKPIRLTQAMVNEQYPATNRTTTFRCGEPLITFDRGKRSVRWEVPEGNHARDHGRNHPIAQALFKALDRVQWTRGTGGKIVGNDEYNRDSEYEGGGGNYVIDEYGPKVQRQPAHTYGRRW